MQWLDRLYSWYGKRVVRTVGALVLMLVIVGVGIGRDGGDAEKQEVATEKRAVNVRRVGDLDAEGSFTAVGTVRSVSEARLQAETGGRVTSVSVALGDTVRAGTVIASIENSRESAALLQAEGAYESALAASLKSEVSLSEARTSARNAYRDAFSTADTVLRNTIDTVFSKTGNDANGFRLAGSGQASMYISARNAVAQQITAWGEQVTQGGVAEEELGLAEAESVVLELSNLTTQITPLLVDTEIGGSLSADEKATLAVQFANARASLDGVLADVSRARETLEQAKLSAVSPTPSQASAQLKTALGVLRSAQANYEKTLVRTPIAGVINALYVTPGSYVSQGQEAALIANNGSLEITTALGEDDRMLIKEGDVVRINETETGVITHVAPAVDPLTGKSEVRISVDGNASLSNGSTARVTFVRTSNVTEVEREGEPITVPLAALKLLSSGPLVFTVSSEGVLIAHPVTLGAIVGESVEITEGLTRDDVIVTDARGLREGDVVAVTQ